MNSDVLSFALNKKLYSCSLIYFGFLNQHLRTNGLGFIRGKIVLPTCLCLSVYSVRVCAYVCMIRKLMDVVTYVQNAV